LALEDILRALEDKTGARIEVIQNEARQRVAEILSEVDKDAARMKRAKLKKVEDAVRSEATAIVYSASLKAKNELIKAQEETVDEAFRLAEARLSELYKDERYPSVLGVLLDEALEFFEGEVVLQVRQSDRELVEKLMAQRQRQYRLSESPLEASGGLMASSPGGEVIVSNTFESRLDKARDKLRLEISKALFEEAGAGT
jgi:V/A-type H+/Na+-transporting ATPase subunit E